MPLSRHRTWAVLGVLALAPLAAPAAGSLYGTVLRNGQPAGGLTIELACPRFAQPRGMPARAPTDRGGAFTLFAPAGALGSCELRASSGNTAGAPIEVFVADSPLKIDLAIDTALNLRMR